MCIYSRDEIEDILNKYGDKIYRMAFIQVKRPEVADDIYQEVCMKLIQQKTRIEPDEHLKAWLLRTTINCCKDYWKSSWIQKISWGENQETNDVFENAVEESQETGYLTECVQKLPEKYRTAIHLYYYEGYSQKEIAALLGEKENTVASWMKRGTERLKRMLEKSEVEAYEF